VRNVAHPIGAKGASRYTSRIQKGGALLNEMRQLVQVWTDSPLDEVRSEIIRSNVLNKATRARSADVLNRIFIPRVVDGPIRDAWRLIRPLESLQAPAALIRPIYFWFTTLAEPLIYDFCTEFLAARRSRGIRSVDVSDAVSWVESKGCGWSEIVTVKVVRALLAALRDFGILEGKVRKQISSQRISPQSFAFIAFCLHRAGAASRNLAHHPDWRLFMLEPSDVEHYFLECHQLQLLGYQAAGNTISISFPVSTAEEYARVVVGK
jgi:hypothetical protein